MTLIGYAFKVYNGVVNELRKATEFIDGWIIYHCDKNQIQNCKNWI